MYILDFLEDYSKQKGSTDPPAIYLIHYLEKRQITKTSVRKTANGIAISLAHYQAVNNEIEFFYKIFCQTTPMMRPAANYIYCRKIVRSFFNAKHSLENLKISLGHWTTLVQKIFRDHPTSEIIDRLKDKIMNYNLKRVLGHNISPNSYHDSNLSLRSQHQLMDIDALYFVVICVEEFQDHQTTRSPVLGRDRSRSPPLATGVKTSGNKKSNNDDFILQSNYHSPQLSNYSSISHSPPIQEKKRQNFDRTQEKFDPLGLMRAAKASSMAHDEEEYHSPDLFEKQYRSEKVTNKSRKASSSYLKNVLRI